MIAGILAPGGSGGTFFDWTLHYLIGDRQHLVIDIQDCSPRPFKANWRIVPDDPLQNLTAHEHKKTHPKTFAEISACFDMWHQECQSGLYSFFFVDRMDLRKHTCHREIITAYPDIKFFSFHFQEHTIDHLFVLQMEKIPDHEARMLAEIAGHRCIDEIPIWQKRELLALYYFESIRNQTLCENLDSMTNHLCIDWQDFIYRFDTKVVDIFDWLGITIDDQRWNKWTNVYNQWQCTLSNEFAKSLPDIISSIVHNLDSDLTRFHMSTAKEIVLERLLLYKHNMGIRSYGWQKLPGNTRNWHAILAPNIYHKI